MEKFGLEVDRTMWTLATSPGKPAGETEAKATKARAKETNQRARAKTKAKGGQQASRATYPKGQHSDDAHHDEHSRRKRIFLRVLGLQVRAVS